MKERLEQVLETAKRATDEFNAITTLLDAGYDVAVARATFVDRYEHKFDGKTADAVRTVRP